MNGQAVIPCYIAGRHPNRKKFSPAVYPCSGQIEQKPNPGKNLQREDLTVFESIEAIVEILDAELIDSPEYVSMGHHDHEPQDIHFVPILYRLHRYPQYSLYPVRRYSANKQVLIATLG